MPGVPLSRDAIAHRGGIALLIFEAHPHDGGVARQGYRRLPVPAAQGVCVHFTPATTQPIKDVTFGNLLYRFSALVRKMKRTSVAVMELELGSDLHGSQLRSLLHCTGLHDAYGVTTGACVRYVCTEGFVSCPVSARTAR